MNKGNLLVSQFCAQEGIDINYICVLALVSKINDFKPRQRKQTLKMENTLTWMGSVLKLSQSIGQIWTRNSCQSDITNDIECDDNMLLTLILLSVCNRSVCFFSPTTGEWVGNDGSDIVLPNNSVNSWIQGLKWLTSVRPTSKRIAIIGNGENGTLSMVGVWLMNIMQSAPPLRRSNANIAKLYP